MVIPAGLGLLSTFTDYSPQQANWKVVGLLNYQQVFEDHTLGSAFTNGIVLTLLTIPLELTLAVIVASLLHRPFRGRSFVRVLLLLPWLVSPMAAGVMWHFLYNGQVGISAWLGRIFNSVYIASPLANPAWALPVLALSEVWRIAPLAAFLLLPGVLAIPQDQLDYAFLEGGSNWIKWCRIILPQMRVLILTVLLLLVGQNLGEFDSILILTGGGPGTRTMTPALYSYNLAITGHNWPSGVTVAWLLEGIVLVAGIFYISLIRSEVR
jgi:ABC-type sugar transport system permease subunit